MQYYKKLSHTVYDCTYHIVWVTKYRYNILVGDIGRRVKDLIQEICKNNGVEILRGKIASNHVHIANTEMFLPQIRKNLGIDQ